MTTGAKAIALALLAAAGLHHPLPALAQSYTIQKPGELPTYIRRTGGGKDEMTAVDAAKYLSAVTDSEGKKTGKR